MSFKSKERRKFWIIKRRQSFREIVKNHLKENPCAGCGNTDIRTLEFDHIDKSTKTSSISKLMNGTPSMESLLKEMAKCQVLCANCHRIKTLESRDYLNSNNQRMIE